MVGHGVRMGLEVVGVFRLSCDSRSLVCARAVRLVRVSCVCDRVCGAVGGVVAVCVV